MSKDSPRKKDVAHRFFVEHMKVLEVNFNAPSGKPEYLPARQLGEDTYPDYPVLIQGNGLPWTLGNMYLLMRIGHSKKYEPKTWKNISLDLIHYLRWLEEHNINPLYFPTKQKFNRPTYKYRAHLLEQANQGVIAASTASARMSSVIGFYRGLMNYGIIKNELIGVAWSEKEVLLRVIGRDLQPKLYSIRTTDLAIKKPPRSLDTSHILDGGPLRPLSVDEQAIIGEHLKSSSATYRLMFAFAILTGARVATICTLRGKTLQDAIYDKANSRYLIHVGGPGHLVDTKGSRRLTIVIPARLHEILTNYWMSSQAFDRRLKSYYGDNSSNYIFLNNQGEPFITSKTEKMDRKSENLNSRLSTNEGLKRTAKSRDGQAIWAFINNVLLPRIRKKHPEFKSFSFHDLRATFGMNLLETLLHQMDTANADLKLKGKQPAYRTEWALEQIQERLGHSSIATTMRYLNFRRNTEFKASLQMKIEDELMKYVTKEVLSYDD